MGRPLGNEINGLSPPLEFETECRTVVEADP